MSVDYRDILKYDRMKLVSNIEALSGYDVFLLLNDLNYYNLPFKLNDLMFSDDERYESVVFEELSKRVYEHDQGDYRYVMTLYSFRGEVFDGKMISHRLFGDDEMDEDLRGFEDGEDMTVPVLLYLFDGVRHLM